MTTLFECTETKDAQHVQIKTSTTSNKETIKLLCVSDTHDFQGQMDELPNADILIHAGDFTCRGAADEIRNFIKWTDDLLENGTVKHVVFIAGNHECSLPLTAKNPRVLSNQKALKEALTDRKRVHYLEDSSCEVMGLRFYGSPWTTLYGRDWAYQARDTAAGLGEKYKSMPKEGEIDILITHGPPFGQLDSDVSVAGAAGGARIGSRQLLAKVAEIKPLIHIFGHHHAGYGISSFKPVPTSVKSSTSGSSSSSDAVLTDISNLTIDDTDDFKSKAVIDIVVNDEAAQIPSTTADVIDLSHAGSHGPNIADAGIADLKTVFINAAICDEDYSPSRKPWLVEISPQ